MVYEYVLTGARMYDLIAQMNESSVMNKTMSGTKAPNLEISAFVDAVRTREERG